MVIGFKLSLMEAVETLSPLTPKFLVSLLLFLKSILYVALWLKISSILVTF